MAGRRPGDNSRRPYRSPVRAEAARRTRTAILAAAHELFVASGYAGTSLRGIAQAAGVSVPTIEQAFGTKAKLLKTVVDVTTAGDDQPIPMLERAPAQAALATPTVADFLSLVTAEIAVVSERVSGIFTVVEQAAASDKQIARLAGDLDAQRRVVASWILDAVNHRGGRLRPGLSADQAIDTIWLLMGPAGYRQLTHGRGWTTDVFTQWLCDAISQLVLAPNPGRDTWDARA
jgi:AcrR family transcriptional regulator